MKKNELLNAMEGIAPELIIEAEREKPALKRILRTVVPAAACLCVALGIFAVVKLHTKSSENAAAQQTGEIQTMQEANAAPNGSNSVDAQATDNIEDERSSVFEPVAGETDEAKDMKRVRTFITDYPRRGSTEHPLIPGGQYALSPTLRAAMNEYGALDEYGNEITYIVSVELYEGVCQLVPVTAGEHFPFPNVEEEAVRLCNEEGIIYDFSRYYDGENTTWSLRLHITAKQLESFPASPRYGYWIMLASEELDEYGRPIAHAVFEGNN